MIHAKVIGTTEVLRGLEKMGAEVQAKVGVEIRRSASRVLVDARAGVPVAYGRLKASGKVEAQGNNAKVSFGAGYAQWVEFGRRPGKWPPPRPIEDWVKKKGIASEEKRIKSIAFSVRRKIGQKGTSKQPFLRPAFERERLKFKDALRRIV